MKLNSVIVIFIDMFDVEVRAVGPVPLRTFVACEIALMRLVHRGLYIELYV